MSSFNVVIQHSKQSSTFMFRSMSQASYAGSQPSLDYLHRRRLELLSQLEERKVISPPPFAASPTLSHPFPSDYPPEVSTVSISSYC